MRVLHLIDSAGVYGAEQVVLSLATELRQHGVSTILGSLRLPGEGEKPIERAAAECGIPVWPIFARRGLDGNAFYTIAGRVAEGIDIIHSHGYKANILTALYAGRVCNVPTVSTLHGWTGTTPLRRIWWYETVERRLLGRFDAVVAVNADMSDVSKIGARVRNRLVVIANGIATTARAPSELMTDFPELQRVEEFCARAPTIVAAGRLSAEKGFQYLLDAIAMLSREGTRVQLVIAGDGVLRHELAARAAQLGIADRVLFTGFVPDVAALFPLFDIFALPSMREGLPIVLLEAMRAGIPSIASSVGGIPELLGYGEYGVVVPPANPEKLADGLRALLNAPESARSVGQKARRRFEEKYTVSGMARRYLSLYWRLVETRCPSRVAV